MAEAFIPFCEDLWSSWLAGRLDLPPFAHTAFDLDAAPEPYISFRAGAESLVALTTNPGATMPHQRRAEVQAGGGPLNPTLDYATAARALGAFYEVQLTSAARRRVAGLRALASLAGFDGVLQVEACPFHSPSLGRKPALLQTIREGGLLGRYAEHVRAFLRRRPVVIVSAVSTQDSLGPGIRLSPWLAWKAALAGLVPERAEFVPLVAKGSSTTAAALVSFDDKVPKAIVLMMGGNQLPAAKGLRVLAAALR